MATATRLRERPIRLRSEEVIGILQDRKTQHRELLLPQPPEGITQLIGPEWYTPKVIDRHGKLVEGPMVYGVYDPEGEWGQKFPYWPGTRLWVREAWAHTTAHDGQYILDGRKALYRATDGDWFASRWRPSIHMPRWASRITLEVLEVRVQRVQEISEEDAKAEGIPTYHDGTPVDAIWGFRHIWEALNLRRGFGWDANPWVRAVTFQRVTTEHAEASDEAHQDD